MSSEHRVHIPKGALLLGLLALPLLGGTAWAQSGPVIISGSGTTDGRAPVLTDPTGSVTVDWGVLDSLGSNPRPSSAAPSTKGPIVLVAPKATPKHKHKPRAVAKSKPGPAAAPAPNVAKAAPASAAKPVAAPATVTKTVPATIAAAAATVEPLMASRAPTPQAIPVSAPETATANRIVSTGSTPVEMPPPPTAPTLPPVAAVLETASSAAHVASVSNASVRPSQPLPLTAPPPPASVAPPPTAPSVAASPVAAPATPATEAPRSVASLSTPPSPVSLPASVGSPASIVFAADSSQLPNDARSRLDAVIRSMTGNDRLRAQIIAYAAGTADSASQARRLSLSRALAVRAYLIEKGVASTRLDVRALGHQTDGGAPDRVDIAFAAR